MHRDQNTPKASCRAHLQSTPQILHFPVADGTKHKEISPKHMPGDRAQKRKVFTCSLGEEMQQLLSHQPQQSLLKMYTEEVSFRANS